MYSGQALLRRALWEEGLARRQEIALARRLLAQLPRSGHHLLYIHPVLSTNKLNASNFLATSAGLHTDAGFFDLLLHRQDVAYTVPQLHGALLPASLHPAGW